MKVNDLKRWELQLDCDSLLHYEDYVRLAILRSCKHGKLLTRLGQTCMQHYCLSLCLILCLLFKKKTKTKTWLKGNEANRKVMRLQVFSSRCKTRGMLIKKSDSELLVFSVLNLDQPRGFFNLLNLVNFCENNVSPPHVHGTVLPISDFYD